MEQWQDAASQQVELLAGRLNELLSKGLDFLRSELGVDLGLKPELIPPWMILLAACAGLVLMVALWASVCRPLFKKRPVASPADDGLEAKRGVGKPVKADEPKKKKKKTEKKAQPNGRAVSEPQEEAIVPEETLPHHQAPPPEAKAEKAAEVKKSKKKAKQTTVKETKTVTADGKEPEEGTWETKVSNKEKREQRKKDKSSSDGSASPGGGDTPVSAPPEQPKASAAQKKKKGESAKVKAEKVEAAVPQANSSEVTEAAAVVADMAVKAPAHTVAPKTGPWTTSREAASLWGSGIDESWTVIDRGVSGTELNLVSLSGLGVGTAESQAVSELPWLSQARVDDEWSGLNGGSVDPSSDWNAPSEAWGNYEEPAPEPAPAQEQPVPEPAKVELLAIAAEDDDDEKDKGETAADAAAKSKKKKKKKKKAAEEGGAGDQVEEPEKETAPAAPLKKQPPVQELPAAVQPVKAAAVEQARVEKPVKDNKSQKPPVTQVPLKPTDGESTAKQNNVPAPAQQKKPEDSQAPKPAKKKKARRET